MKNFLKRLAANPMKALEFLQWVQLLLADAVSGWEAFKQLRQGRKQWKWYEDKMDAARLFGPALLDSIEYEKIEEAVQRRGGHVLKAEPSADAEAEARKAEAGNAMVTAAHRRQEEVQRNREALTKPIPSNGPLHFTPLGDKKDD